MSSTRVRFCCAASSLSSAARRRLLYLVTPGRLLDQLPAIGGPGAEDLADLALLDDRVALHAHARVHQQILHVLQAAGLAVDQVFALARSIEPAHQLDVADDQRRLVFEQRHRGAGENAVGGDLRIRDRRRDLDAVPVPVAVAMRCHGRCRCHWPCAAVARRGVPGHARRHAAELEAHFGGGGGPPRVAAAEDHVLHPLAAQALGALLAEHPGQRVDDVALPAAVRPDDRGDAGVEGELGSIRKALEAGNLQALQSHGVRVPS